MAGGGVTIHDNWFMGNCEALIMHKGVGWVQIYNNHFIDNMKAICVAVKGVSVMPINEIDGAGLEPHGFFLPDGITLTDAEWFRRGDLVQRLGRFHRFSFWDPCGIYELSSCPFDTWEMDDEGRRYFTIEEVRIFRNVIAASWSNGIHLREGAQPLACEKDLDGDGGTPYALTIRNVVIAQNTLVGNGGAWLSLVDCGCSLRTRPPVEGEKDIAPTGYGILLDHSETPAVGDGIDPSRTHAFLLGDHYEGVAIYNNLLCNNFCYQLFVMDSSKWEGVFSERHDKTVDYNVIQRPPGERRAPEGIQGYRYIAIDFNAYCYNGIGVDRTAYRSFEVIHVPDPVATATFSLPVDTCLTTFKTEDDFEAGVSSDGRYRFAVETIRDASFRRDLAFDVNRVELSSEELLFDYAEWSDILEPVRNFTFARDLRGEYDDEALLDYYRMWCDGNWQPWRTREGSGLRGTGARGADDFPDETPQAETGAPVYRSPDIEGNAVGVGPEIGAYELTPPLDWLNTGFLRS